MYNALNKNASKALEIVFEVFHNSAAKYSNISSFIYSFFSPKRNFKEVELPCYIILTSYLAS